MNNNFDEKYIIELVKKELSKYLTEQGIEMKKQISFLGDDKDIEEKLSQKFEISENAGTLVVSKLSLKNLYNISNAIYENDYEEKIIKFLLENKEIIIIKEGIEYSKYENIPVAVLKRYEEYIEKIKTYGIKIESKDFYINSLEKKEEVIARIKEASQYVPLENLYLSTQCGFASTEEGNILTEEDQWKKIGLIKEIVADVWGE